MGCFKNKQLEEASKYTEEKIRDKQTQVTVFTRRTKLEFNLFNVNEQIVPVNPTYQSTITKSPKWNYSLHGS